MTMSGHAPPEAVIGVSVGMAALSGLAVGARLYARLKMVHNAGVDDAFITAAWLFSVATTVTMCLQGALSPQPITIPISC
jgi:hypothetical protein